MPSQFQIHDDTWGTLSIFAITVNDDGTWEDDWEPLRTAEELESIRDLISPISSQAYFELKHRYTRPFLDEVGLDADACFMKLALEIKTCHYKDSCPSFEKGVCEAHQTPPPCYDANVDNDRVRPIVTRLYDLWRLGFYVILVQPENANG
jgi:hypothetical protein